MLIPAGIPLEANVTTSREVKSGSRNLSFSNSGGQGRLGSSCSAEATSWVNLALIALLTTATKPEEREWDEKVGRNGGREEGREEEREARKGRGGEKDGKRVVESEGREGGEGGRRWRDGERDGEREGGVEGWRGREEWEGREGNRRGKEEGEKACNHYMFTFILPSYTKRISVALNETNVPVEKQDHSCETHNCKGFPQIKLFGSSELF